MTGKPLFVTILALLVTGFVTGCVKYVPVATPSTPPKAPAECTAPPESAPKMKPFPRRKADGSAWTVPEINAKWVEHQIAADAVRRRNEAARQVCVRFHRVARTGEGP
jgi:hypothetical protein